MCYWNYVTTFMYQLVVALKAQNFHKMISCYHPHSAYSCITCNLRWSSTAEHCLGGFAYCQNLCRLFAGRVEILNELLGGGLNIQPLFFILFGIHCFFFCTHKTIWQTKLCQLFLKAFDMLPWQPCNQAYPGEVIILSKTSILKE